MSGGAGLSSSVKVAQSGAVVIPVDVEMGEAQIESSGGNSDPPMTLPPGQEQELIGGALGPCDSSVNLPQWQIALMPEAMGARMRSLGRGSGC